MIARDVHSCGKRALPYDATSQHGTEYEMFRVLGVLFSFFAGMLSGGLVQITPKSAMFCKANYQIFVGDS